MTGQIFELPALRSYFAPEALAHLLEAEYGLSGVNCQLIKAMMCDTYKVTTTSNSFILKIYRYNRRIVSEITSELDFLDFLNQHNLKAAAAIPRKNGERLLPFKSPEGMRYGILFTFIEGVVLSQKPEVGSARLFGQTLARLHLLADNFPASLTNRPGLNVEMLLDQPLAALESVIATRSEVLKTLQEAAAIIRPKIAALPTTNPYYGLCHGDIDSSNVIISAGGEAVLIDFDYLGFGWRAYDLALIPLEVKFSSWPQAFSEAFLEGYQEIRSLEQKEINSFPLFEVARNIWSLGLYATNINEWGSFRLSERFIKQMVSLIQTSLEKVV